ncbi:MAG: diguanylate cyclase [Lachnospiraceae bacterium]|nr:diguanylate cyclase [Lachnospiraceae bacterium]
MYYSGFGLLSLILHLIINNRILRQRGSDIEVSYIRRYRQFLLIITVYFITDVLWGILDSFHMVYLLYADTVLYFLSMALSVLVWTKFVVEYIDRKGAKSNSLIYTGWAILALVVLSLVINFFHPVIFEFRSSVGYVPSYIRYLLFAILFLLHLVLSIYSFIVSTRSSGKDAIHYRAVSISGVTMAVLIMLQTMYPLLPFYAIGLIISISLIHVFVEEDERMEMNTKLNVVTRKAELERKMTEKARYEKEIYNNIAESLAEDYEAIYYIDIETGKYREFSASKEYEALKVPKYCENFYTETRANAHRFAHPDDREYAESFYYKDVMLKNLEGRNSFSYMYRIMVKGEPRYFRFTLMLAKDEKHFLVCVKDIEEEIAAEKAFRDDRKKHITFGQIAESLASNYDNIYYVNIEKGHYVSYTSQNLYGQLEIAQTGDDFFEEAKKNIPQIIHPRDVDRMLNVIDKDRLLSALDDRKEFSVEYRIFVDGRSEHIRLSARRSSDQLHFIIGVENIDDEVSKEKEHLKALNTEKELARRDELTGTKNKTAYIELEKSVQSNIDNGMDYLPFAIAVCDINDLKKVNDTKGHKAGDDYIRSAAKLLCDIFDHSPVFRIGGDEFLIFLRGDDYSMREQLMNRLQKQIKDNLADGSGPVIASGMSEYIPKDDAKVSEVFERADNAMYENKRRLKEDRS